MKTTLAFFRALQPATAAVLVLPMLHPAAAQPLSGGPPLSAGAAAIHSKVQSMPVGGAITVNLSDGHEYYGRIKSIESDSFSIHEVDLRRDLTFSYEDVKKVGKGYGRKNSISGKRIPPHRALITTLIVVGALLTLVIAAVAADKS